MEPRAGFRVAKSGCCDVILGKYPGDSKRFATNSLNGSFTNRVAFPYIARLRMGAKSACESANSASLRVNFERSEGESSPGRSSTDADATLCTTLNRVESRNCTSKSATPRVSRSRVRGRNSRDRSDDRRAAKYGQGQVISLPTLNTCIRASMQLIDQPWLIDMEDRRTRAERQCAPIV
jgi:hypothetical protein